MFRRAQRLHDAMIAEEPVRDRMRRELILVQRTVKLGAAGLKRVNARLLELANELQRSQPAAGGAFYTVTLHLVRNRARR